MRKKMNRISALISSEKQIHNESFVVVTFVVAFVTMVCVVVSMLEAREENRQTIVFGLNGYTSVFLWILTFLNKKEQTFSVV